MGRWWLKGHMEQHTGGHRDTDHRKARGAQDTRHVVYWAQARVVQGTHQHRGKGQRAQQESCAATPKGTPGTGQPGPRHTCTRHCTCRAPNNTRFPGHLHITHRALRAATKAGAGVIVIRLLRTAQAGRCCGFVQRLQHNPRALPNRSVLALCDSSPELGLWHRDRPHVPTVRNATSPFHRPYSGQPWLLMNQMIS